MMLRIIEGMDTSGDGSFRGHLRFLPTSYESKTLRIQHSKSRESIILAQETNKKETGIYFRNIVQLFYKFTILKYKAAFSIDEINSRLR